MILKNFLFDLSSSANFYLVHISYFLKVVHKIGAIGGNFDNFSSDLDVYCTSKLYPQIETIFSKTFL